MIPTRSGARVINTRQSAFQWRGGRSIVWQVVGVVLVWLYIVVLHRTNDGLWFYDAPHHAANGLFWWEFLASFPVNPIEFALGYYARYPVISPLIYPPVFYLLEGAAFWLFGNSPFVAKGLVLGFALSAGLYVTVWLRRWITEESGWGGALLVLQPGIVAWSNAIMLNIPSMALGVAALYHARRWFESPDSRHIYPAAFFTILALLTYYPAGIVVFVFLAWLVAQGQGIILWDRRALIIGLVSVLVLLPFMVIIFKWAPIHTGWVFANPTQSSVWLPSRWTYYAQKLPELFTTPLLCLAGSGIVIAMMDQRWRREVKLALIWAIVVYIGFSYIEAKEARYVLLLGPPLVFMGVIGLVSCLRWVATQLGGNPTGVFLAGMAALLGLHVWIAPLVRVPLVNEFQEVVRFFERTAPEKRVFYDGNYNGVFSFYLLSRDPKFQRGVVLGRNLLYEVTMNPELSMTKRVSSVAEVVDLLRTKCGCRWLAVERGMNRPEAEKYLREAVARPEFEFVKAFPIAGPRDMWIDVYRFIIEIQESKEIELFFPELGEATVFRVKPLER